MKFRLLVLITSFIGIQNRSLSQQLIMEKGSPVIIRGDLGSMKIGDTIKFKAGVLKYGFLGTYLSKEIDLTQPSFQLNLGDINQSSYIQIRIDSGKFTRMLTNWFLIGPGDTIVLHKAGTHFTYSGTNPNTSYLQKLFNMGTELRKKRWGPKNPMKPTVEDYNYSDSVTLVRLSYLESIKNKVTPTAYFISKINLLASNQYRKNRIPTWLLNKDNHLRLASNVYQPDEKYPNYKSVENALLRYKDVIEEKLLQASVEYPQYLPFTDYILAVNGSYIRDSCVKPDRPYDFNNHYSYLKKNFNGLLRERLIVEVINNNIKNAVDKKYFVDDALSFVINIDFRDFLLALQSSVNGK